MYAEVFVVNILFSSNPWEKTTIYGKICHIVSWTLGKAYEVVFLRPNNIFFSLYPQGWKCLVSLCKKKKKPLPLVFFLDPHYPYLLKEFKKSIHPFALYSQIFFLNKDLNHFKTSFHFSWFLLDPVKSDKDFTYQQSTLLSAVRDGKNNQAFISKAECCAVQIIMYLFLNLSWVTEDSKARSRYLV